MTALDTIKSIIQTGTAQTKQTLTTGTYRGGVDLSAYGPNGQRAADWSAIADNPKLERSYRICATAYACSTFLADAVAESPLKVYQWVDGEPKELPNHKARTLLANPNPYMSEAEFMSLTVMVMALYGYAAVEKVRNGGGGVVQLWPIRPDWLKREMGNSGEARWVLRRPRSEARVIPDDDIILIPYRHDEKLERIGISPLQIVAREIGIDVALTDLLKVFLDAGGIPPWAVELPDSNPKQADIDVFREKWRQMYGGWGAYANIGILYGGMKLHKLGDSIGDMAWPDLRGLTELKIAQAFRVPAELIQARDSFSSGSLTTTEVDGAMAALQKHGATPLRQRIDGAFSRGLLPEMTGGDSSITLEFDISEILALQEDRDALHARVRADYDSGGITLNQFLQETGRPEIGTPGDVYKVPFSVVYLPAKALVDEPTTITPTPPPALPATTPKAIGRVYRDHKSLSPVDLEFRSRSLRTLQRERQKIAEIGERKLRRFFREQGERIVSVMPGKTAGDIDTKELVVDWNGEFRKLSDVLNQLYQAAGERSFSMVSQTVGVELSWDLFNPRIRQLMDSMGLRITGIHEETRAQVIKIVTDGLAEGMSPPQIADRLTDKFDEFSKSRANTISRTESAHMFNKSSGMAYIESGVISAVELDDNAAHDTDPMEPTGTTCADRAGLIIPVEEIDRYTDSMHPNCVMAVIPILSGPALGEV